jgi:hypothetical protein
MDGRIIVHSLDQARAALAAASSLKRKAVLASAAGAGCYAGPAWFKSLVEQAQAAYPEAETEAVLDCGDAAGVALAALRLGLKRVGFSGGNEARARLKEIAHALGAAVESGGDEDALDLRDKKNPQALCAAYLAGETMA